MSEFIEDHPVEKALVVSADRVWVSVERLIRTADFENIKISAGACVSTSATNNNFIINQARELLVRFEDLVDSRAIVYEA